MMSAIIFIFLLSLIHITLNVASRYNNGEVMQFLVALFVYVIIPLKDASIAMMLVRLYYYHAQTVLKKSKYMEDRIN